MLPLDAAPVGQGLLEPTVMGPPIVWLASDDAAGVHDERIGRRGVPAVAARPERQTVRRVVSPPLTRFPANTSSRIALACAGGLPKADAE